MNQKELNDLYGKLTSEEEMSYDAGFDQYHKILEKFEYAGGDWKEDGHDDFIRILTKYGFKVLKDPSTEGTDSWGYVIVPPKPSE